MSSVLAKVPVSMTDTPLTPRRALPVVQDDRSDWEMATAKQRSVVRERMTLLFYVIEKADKGISNNAAVKNVLMRLEAGALPQSVTETAYRLGRQGKLISAGTLRDWLKKYQTGGREALLSGNNGRKRLNYGWEDEAVRMFNIPSKPSAGEVAKRLRALGHKSATYSRVLAFINALPATLGKESPARLGKAEYRLTHAPSKVRDTNCLLVGEVYQGDGHTIDAYLAHPNTGNCYRPELTVWIDVRSRYIASYHMSDAESAISTLYSLSRALIDHDHVPTWLHIDNGSGFKAKLLNDRSIGYYARFDMNTMFSIPGNPRGKGQIERWFLALRNGHDKFWNEGRDYCGHDQSKEATRRINREIEQGKRKLMSVAQYKDSLDAFIKEYNNTAHSALNGKTPAQLWATLERNPVYITADAIVRPQKRAMVRKWQVTIDKRRYRHDILKEYDGKYVTVEYDLEDDSEVTILDADQRMICIAALQFKDAYLPDSRLIEGREKRLKGQLKRKQRAIDEDKQRAITPITDINTQRLEVLDSTPLNADLLLSENEEEELNIINILDNDHDN